MNKVNGSGGYILAELLESEKRKNIGGEYFIGAIGRIEEKRIRSYHCNKCNKDFEGSPIIKFNKLDREEGGVTIVEEGEYRCRECNSIIASYKLFKDDTKMVKKEEDSPISLSKFIGMNVYNEKAKLIGIVEDICINNNNIILRVKGDGIKDIAWDKVIAIKDIVLIKIDQFVCSKCNYVNKEGAKFCEMCGARL